MVLQKLTHRQFLIAFILIGAMIGICFFVQSRSLNIKPIGSKSPFLTKPSYVEPIDGALIPGCPLIQLEGMVIRHTFPGIPNYQSLEEGDKPEMRWVLVISEFDIQRLTLAGYLPPEDIFTANARGWVQLIPPHTEQDPLPFLNRRVGVRGFFGELYTHAHTPVAIEAMEIYDTI